jgi:hypothetical protein
MNAKKPKKHQRVVHLGVVLPVSVELLVGTSDDDPDADSDWEILEVRHAHCETTARLVTESLTDEDLDLAALNEVAARAKDVAC